MNFINLNGDNSLRQAHPCTPHGLSYMSHEGSDIGLTRPASPCTVQHLAAPSSTGRPALVPLPLHGGSGSSSHQALIPSGWTLLGSSPTPNNIIFQWVKQLVPLPLQGAGWDSPPQADAGAGVTVPTPVPRAAQCQPVPGQSPISSPPSAGVLPPVPGQPQLHHACPIMPPHPATW